MILSMIRERFGRVLQNERGMETLEWVAVGVGIVAMAVAVYGSPGTLQTAITTTMGTISSTLNP